MADVIRGQFGNSKRSKSGWLKYNAQETGEPPTPDIKRPPDSGPPDAGNDMPDEPEGPGAPPFTGEDVEDATRGRKRRDIPTM